jgi:hypothetical protein
VVTSFFTLFFTVHPTVDARIILSTMSLADIERDIDSNKHRKAPFQRKYSEWARKPADVTTTNDSADYETLERVADTMSRVMKLRADIMDAQFLSLSKEADEIAKKIGVSEKGTQHETSEST